MNNSIKEKNRLPLKECGEKTLLWILINYTFALVLRVISYVMFRELEYRIILAFIPLLLIVFIRFMGLKIKFDNKNLINHAMITSGLIYLISFKIMDNQQFEYFISNILAILILIYTLYLCGKRTFFQDQSFEESELQGYDKPLFMIYYLNFAKTYDFVTLIDNKFKVKINNETHNEISNHSENTIGIKHSGINAGTNSNSMTSKTEKILENFEIKDTKSTHLQEIMIRAKAVQSDTELEEGSLVKFSKVQLELRDKQENIEIVKLLLGGVFNGINLKGQDKGMDYELNLSSLMQSFLSGLEYQLTFKYGNDSYYITIPLTGNDDFENGYTVNDLLTGKVTILGIYKGKYNRQVPLVNSLFSSNENNNFRNDMIKPVQQYTPSEYPEENDKQRNTSDNSKLPESELNGFYIDIIAVIQEVYFNSGED